MGYKLTYNPNNDTQITPSVDYNQWLKRLNTQLNELTNKNSMKVPKVVSQQIKKRYYKTLVASVLSVRNSVRLRSSGLTYKLYCDFMSFN